MSEWIISIIVDYGWLGLFFLMLIENILPPIPSELVLPIAGTVAARGEISAVAALFGATLGSVIGTLPYYLVGRWIGVERLKALAPRYGRLLTVTPREIDRIDAWFDHHGRYAVLVGRLVPGVRTLISIPAGISGMTLRRFLAYTTLGTFAWNALLITIGFGLSTNSHVVQAWIGPIGNLVLFAAFAYWLYRVVTFGRQI